MASEPYDMKRLGGPPGLYDAPNRERGGTILRVRVPDAPETKDFYGIGPLDVPSLNDCDDGMPDMASEKAKLEDDMLRTGVPYRKSITGDKM